MKISLCTTSMNRLEHIKITLPKNIEDNKDFKNVEFVLLNYNSSDDLDDWIYDTQMDHIRSGRLVYVKETNASNFLPAHSRNVCALCSSGDVICNVDADNYTGLHFAQDLAKFFSNFKSRAFAYCSDVWKLKNMSAHGRLALFKKDFVRIGGYDDRQIGWGEEDTALIRRCQAMEFSEYEFKENNLKYISHSHYDRVQFVNLNDIPRQKLKILSNPNHLMHRRIWYKSYERDYLLAAATYSSKATEIIQAVLKMDFSREENEKRSKKSIIKKSFVSNSGNHWGKATIIKNFSNKLEDLKPTWITT